MFPALFRLNQSQAFLSQCPSILPRPTPSSPLSLLLYIFIDETWQSPDSSMAWDIWYANPTLKNKQEEEEGGDG